MTDTTPATSPDLFAGLPTLFRRCVNPLSAKFPGTAAPFVQDGFVWAAGGHIAVRVPVDGLTVMPEWELVFTADTIVEKRAGHLRVPEMKRVWPAPSALRAEPVPLPDGILPAARAEWPCCRCKGLSLLKCNFGHAHDCPDCAGLGIERHTARVQVGPVSLSAWYAHWLSVAGVTEIWPQKDAAAPVLFRVGTLEGVLMPMIPPLQGSQP